MEEISETISKLDKWLEGMRSKNGYTGPISHWWDSSFLYTGVQIDWRYEGIITGYVELYRKTGSGLWLERAKKAGDDAVNNQLPDKKFLNSSFQVGPIEGGTPHEAAVDVGLLELSKLLKEENNKEWSRYFKCAQDNIKEFLIGELWNGKGFQEQSWDATLVPNKNATTIEALILYSEIAKEDLSAYIIPAADVILGSQVLEGAREGGIIHRGTGTHRLAIGIYTARSVSGLIRLFNHKDDERYFEACKKAVGFLESLITGKGTYFGYYKDESVIKCPCWISPSADILRALILAKGQGVKVNNKSIEILAQSISNNQERSGGIRTAHGFKMKGSKKECHGLPEFRDVLPVVGWNDKVLRAFSLLVEEDHQIPVLDIGEAVIDCEWKGGQCSFVENEDTITLKKKNGDEIYKLRKGDSFPKIYKL